MRALIFYITLLIAHSSIAQNKLSLLPFLENGKWGYIDKIGVTIVSPIFEEANEFNGGFATVKKDNFFYLIDTTGKSIFESGYLDIQQINKNYLAIKNKLGFALADINGTVLSSFAYSFIKIAELQTILLKRNELGYDLFNTSTSKLLEGEFNKINIQSTYIEIKKESKVGILDSLHHFLLPMTIGENAFLDQSIPIVKNKNSYSIYGRKGTICGDTLNWNSFKTIAPNFISVWNRPATKYLIAMSSEKIIPFQDHTIYAPLNDNFLVSILNTKKGIINDRGETILPNEFNEVFYHTDKTIRIINQNKIGLFSEKGKLAIEVKYDLIEDFNEDGIAFASINNLWGLITIKGKIIVPISYHNIEITNESYKCYKNKEMDLYILTDKKTIDEVLHFNNVGIVSVYKPIERNYAFNKTIDAKDPEFSSSKNNKFSPAFKSFTYPSNAKIKCLIPQNFKNVDKLHGVYDNAKKSIIIPRNYWDIQYQELETQNYARAILPGDKQVLLHKSGATKNFLPAYKNGKYLPQQIVYIGPFVNGLARVNIGGTFSKGNDIKERGRSTLNFHSLQCNGGYWGYINSNGDVSIKIDLDYASDFYKGKAIVKINGKYGVIDTLYQYIIKPIYGKIEYLENTNKHFFKLTNYKTEWGLLNKNGNIIKNAEFEKVGECLENRIPVRNNNLWGCLNFSGNLIIPFKYAYLNSFSEGIASYQENNKWGLIDSLGNIITKSIYISTSKFSEGLAAIRVKGKWGFIDKKGQVTIPPIYSKVGNFTNGASCVQYKGKWMLINSMGKKISPKKFKQKSEFQSNDLAVVRIKKYYHILKKSNGKFLTHSKYKLIEDFSEGLAKVKTKENKYGFIDTLGKLVIPAIYLNAGNFHENLARVKYANSKWGYINKLNVPKIAPTYLKAEDFYEGRATVIQIKYTTIIDSTGTELFVLPETTLGKCQEGNLLLPKHFYTSQGKDEFGSFKSATPFNGGISIVNYLWGTLLINNKFSRLAEYPEISEFKSDVTSFSVDNRIGLANENGNEIVQVKYQKMSYIGEGIFKVSYFNSFGYFHQSGKWILYPSK